MTKGAYIPQSVKLAPIMPEQLKMDNAKGSIPKALIVKPRVDEMKRIEERHSDTCLNAHVYYKH